MFAARADAEESRLFVRELAALEARRRCRNGGAKQPFWSPDGRALGFFARGKLAKLAPRWRARRTR